MDSRLIKPRALAKPQLLKDYLLDDLSSCSSNGFKSFPRRQCCASTVRFLIEIDLKNKQNQKKHFNFTKSTPLLSRSPSRCALAAFHSVVTAVKRLPFGGGSGGGATPPEKKKLNLSILPRSLSKEILKKTSFWKRQSNHEEIERWKSFDQLMKEDSEPSDTSDSSKAAEAASDGGESKSWSGSDDFTAGDECSSGKFLSDVNSNLPEVRNDAVEVLDNGVVSTESASNSDAGSAGTNSSAKNGEKEQFSPMSVLDCPFDDEDDDEEVSSPFQHRLARVEGTKKKLMQKIQRFECLAQLEPVNLSKRFTSLPDSDSESIASPPPHCSASINEKLIKSYIKEEQQEDEENQAEHKALDLLQQFKDTLPSYGLKIKADKLLLDFFREKIIAHHQNAKMSSKRLYYSFDEELLEEVENWINERKPHELFLEWVVPKNREAYVKDMEKRGEWKLSNQESYEDVAKELETQVFDALLNELLLDISS